NECGIYFCTGIYFFKLAFSAYFETFSAPSAETLFLLVLSILALESAHSIRFLYRHFLSGITKKSLNAFYYVCSYAKVDYSGFMNVTARIALQLIPEDLKSQPIFICIDDTMVAKSGTEFENVSKLFDHAAHNGSNYLNGHCFVSLMMCVPVWNHDKISYLAIPLGYRMWQKKESKLELAASMVRQVMPEFSQQKNVIILCDSWYMKQNRVSIVDEYENLDLIGNARSDSVIYDIAPAPTVHRGRPAKHGRCLSIEDDFTLSDEKVGDYYTNVRRVLTNLFGTREVLAYVTSTARTRGTKRLFFSTISSEELQIFCAWQESSPLNQTGSDRMKYIPLFLYSFRWNIEISYYEQKTFWSLCSYMVRSCKGIEIMVNLINVAYCAMKLLPYQDESFSDFRDKSVQDFRFALSEVIRQQLFFATFVQNIETQIKSSSIINALKQAIVKHEHYL
ncbi:transposase, partial [Agathobacter rectalis]|uniref:IS701 family transposase n=1 Tax=Agathobacter rectalis TaxID=39491 RepID=UPI002E8DDAB9